MPNDYFKFLKSNTDIAKLKPSERGLLSFTNPGAKKLTKQFFYSSENHNSVLRLLQKNPTVEEAYVNKMSPMLGQKHLIMVFRHPNDSFTLHPYTHTPYVFKPELINLVLNKNRDTKNMDYLESKLNDTKEDENTEILLRHIQKKFSEKDKIEFFNQFKKLQISEDDFFDNKATTRQQFVSNAFLIVKPDYIFETDTIDVKNIQRLMSRINYNKTNQILSNTANLYNNNKENMSQLHLPLINEPSEFENQLNSIGSKLKFNNYTEQPNNQNLINKVEELLNNVQKTKKE